MARTARLDYEPFFLSGQQLAANEHSSGVPLLTFDGDARRIRASARETTALAPPHDRLQTERIAPDPRGAARRSRSSSGSGTPRPPEDIEKIATLEIPGSSDPRRGSGRSTAARWALSSSSAQTRVAPSSWPARRRATWRRRRRAPTEWPPTPLAFLPNPLDVVPGRMRKSRDASRPLSRTAGSDQTPLGLRRAGPPLPQRGVPDARTVPLRRAWRLAPLALARQTSDSWRMSTAPTRHDCSSPHG